MLTDQNIQTLRSITSIEALVAFVRRDLGWPIEDEDIEAITYEFQPEELGLKPEHFPKINSIRQLRPPSTEQPWGIFFIDFENKKIPLTVMRRILNHLALSRKAKQSGQAWNPGDLLFLTTYGEQKENAREVAFAHFHESPGDLPTLNVIQWDQDDTPAKLKNTYDTLRTNLQWPEETTSKEEWRHQWAAPFKHKPGHVITTAKQLAEALATLSKSIRDRANELLDAETEKGPLTKLFKAFQESLIHDLKPEDFSDTFAQTISYGLLTAAISRTDMDAGNKGTALLTEDIANLVPVTNPFLKEILETFLDIGGRKKAGMDFDELGVQDVVELLRGDATDLPAVLRDFGNQKQGEDPVIHFYEDYLKAYNKELKVKRGVFYTPKPVVSYIVRSVHELLQTEFGLEDGLASTTTWGEMAAENPDIKIPEGTDPDSHFVTILDPATGTGTFLVEVIDVIWKHLQTKWAKSAAACWEMIGRQPSAGGSFQDFWNDYVADHLLPRLYGYELMMAPYAIAHMKLGLKLGETGYRFATDRRVRVYLTNALEPAHELAPRLIVDWEALAHEALAVKAVKETQRFTVVIGNPPYSKLSGNLFDAAVELIEPFRFCQGSRIIENAALALELNLQDDYVKFFGLCRAATEMSKVGIVGMVTNNNYLSAPTLRGFRNDFISRCGRITILNLHGQTSAKPSDDDKNVFDIEKGVCVGLFINRARKAPFVQYSDLVGSRESKYAALLASDHSFGYARLYPQSPYFRFSPANNSVEDTYQGFVPLSDIFPENSGSIITSRDNLLIAFTADELRDQLSAFRDASSAAKAAEVIGFNLKEKWDAEGSRARLQQHGIDSSKIVKLFYRPLDERVIYYEPSMIDTPSRPMSMHVLNQCNLVLVAPKVKTTASFRHSFVTRHMSEAKSASHDRSTQMFPLYVRPSGSLLGDGATANPSPEIQKSFGDRSPNQLIAFVYAILYSPSYSDTYGEFLKDDYPRIPLPGGPEVFDALIPLGERLVALHLMEAPKPERWATTYRGPADPQVEKVTFTTGDDGITGTVWLDKAQTRGFHGVPVSTWNFHIGGYQVCEKWLKDRGPKKGKPGRTLTPEDIEHYHYIAFALTETQQIMKQIDKAIESHGGWPGAFQGGPE